MSVNIVHKCSPGNISSKYCKNYDKMSIENERKYLNEKYPIDLINEAWMYHKNLDQAHCIRNDNTNVKLKLSIISQYYNWQEIETFLLKITSDRMINLNTLYLNLSDIFMFDSGCHFVYTDGVDNCYTMENIPIDYVLKLPRFQNLKRFVALTDSFPRSYGSPLLRSKFNFEKHIISFLREYCISSVEEIDNSHTKNSRLIYNISHILPTREELIFHLKFLPKVLIQPIIDFI